MRSQIRNNNAVEAYQFQAQNEWRSLLCQSVLLSPSQVLLFQYKIKFIQISAIVKVKRRNQCHAWKVSYACTCGFVKCWGKSRYQKVMLYVPLSKLPQGGVRLGGSACVLIKTQNKPHCIYGLYNLCFISQAYQLKSKHTHPSVTANQFNTCLDFDNSLKVCWHFSNKRSLVHHNWFSWVSFFW